MFSEAGVTVLDSLDMDRITGKAAADLQQNRFATEWQIRPVMVRRNSNRGLGEAREFKN
jgi:hypothetical protein